ncbi:FMN-dependent NADH-azoreductase [Sphingomonas sp. MMS24-J13]|uniref:FMN-dependent NADH-azoreductase n=1 Tax=Sphingomonas sp. MMS24-J13 TaxID=3238686 RepID=UPI00384BE12E
MQILHINSSILGPHSISRDLSAAAVARLSAVHPDATVTYRDLAADPLAHLSGEGIAALMAGQAHAQDADALDEFLAADTVVIGVALYNFTVPTQLKAWVDRLFVPGKTFRYTAAGPEGLAGSKKVILAIARGGIYAPGTPGRDAEHAETWLRTVFATFGVTDLEVVVAEGVKLGDEQRDAAVARAKSMIAELA